MSIEQEMIPRDIPVSASISLTLFFGAALCGLYVFDLWKRVKQTESDLKEIRDTCTDVKEHQTIQDDTLEEYDQRIREKKDFDESDEIEEMKYQAWDGSYKGNEFIFTVRIWREKESTLKKNQEWVHWDGKEDSSCIVRDFYLGNSNPDFTWIFHHFSESDAVRAEMHDTLINGWDSVLKIRIYLDARAKSDILQFVSESVFDGNQTANKVLKKCVDDNLFMWSRILIEED
jgi:hypothetical protein